LSELVHKYTNIQYLGHAGFIVSSAGVRLLVDPWFYPAFLGSWFPFPDNRDLLSDVAGGDFDALYLSHMHEDHFDERLLQQLDRDLTVLVPKYRSKVMVRRLHDMGFANLVVLGHEEQHKLADGFMVTMLLDTSHKEDSGLLFDLNGFRFLDLNDCNTPLSELPTGIDLMAAQYSGAMWYPNCYAYPPDVMARKVSEVRASLLETLILKIQLTEAKSYLPSAGPPCFLDPALAPYNNRDQTIFPTWNEISAEFAAAEVNVALIEAVPGDVINCGPATITINSAADPSRIQESSAETYLSDYRIRREEEWLDYYALPDAPLSTSEIESYFRRLQQWNKRFLRDYRKDIRLVADGVTWGIRLGQLSERFVFEDDPVDADYILRVPPRILRAVISGKVGWEEALLSMRLSLHREPDVFDLTLMSLLRYGDHPAQTMQMVRERENSEMFERDGFRMQRYCPHAGEDLRFATICGGIVECPRHHWKWDASTGECLDGGTAPLRIEPLADHGAEAVP
jgi:UDP-MurNAc hydroxylase